MSDYTIEEFCDRHDACDEGREWALANCTSMQDAWDKLKPEWLIWVATRPGVLTDKELRLFAVHCARSVEHLMTDQRSKNAVAVAERYVNGEATDAELSAANAAANAASAANAAANAASVAGRAAANAASAASNAANAASNAASSAAWASSAAAWEAANAASVAARAASNAASSAAWAAMEGFCQYLRANMQPRFTKGGDE